MFLPGHRECVLLGLNRAWRTSEGSFCACACVWIGLDHQLACGGIGPTQKALRGDGTMAARGEASACVGLLRTKKAPGGVLRRVALPLTPELCGRLGHRVRPQRARREGESLSGARVAGAAPLPSGVAGSHPNPEDAPPPPPPRRAVRGSRDRAGRIAPLGAQRRERRDAAQGSRAHLPASDFSLLLRSFFFSFFRWTARVGFRACVLSPTGCVLRAACENYGGVTADVCICVLPLCQPRNFPYR